ncbi:MAG: NAD(P)/FAD-dependent oxidoreductase [Bacteroidetes bacterium]|nr:NAD(P)/FAD-dependent oxidoreductase [Bacteroidota bacterium]
MAKSILIIGSGIAGLTAGIYARLNGFEVEIIEKNGTPGGLCTSWKRKDFIFDGCIHWLTGSAPESMAYKLWEELGAVQGKTFIQHDYFGRLMYDDGKICTFYNNPEKLREELLRIAPEDKKLILRLTKDIRKFAKYEMPFDFKFSDVFKLMPVFNLFYRYRKSGKVWAEKIKSPVLKKLFIPAFEWNGMSIAFALWSMGLMARGDGGYPLGGSTHFINGIADRYIKLGGLMSYHSEVEKILVENNKAIGVRLKTGEDKKADFVISAADGYSTIFKWLEGKYINNRVTRLYRKLKTIPPLVYVSLGLTKDYSKEPVGLTFPVEKPFRIGPDEVKWMTYRNYSFDKLLCPERKGEFCTMISSNYEYWENLYKDRPAYDAEKKRIEEEVLTAISQVYPEIRQQVEVIDVATPMTFTRYTGNWKGSYHGWLMTDKAMAVQLSQTLPGLTNFYMAGQWVTPGGGLPSGLITGRKAIKMVCKKEGKKFVSGKP